MKKAEQTDRMKKMIFLLEHGFYDEYMAKELKEWADNELSEESKWLSNKGRECVRIRPEYDKNYYKKLIDKEVRIFWLKNKFPEFFEKELKR